MRVERESMIMREVPGVGKVDSFWLRSANKCGSDGMAI